MSGNYGSVVSALAFQTHTEFDSRVEVSFSHFLFVTFGLCNSTNTLSPDQLKRMCPYSCKRG